MVKTNVLDQMFGLLSSFLVIKNHREDVKKNIICFRPPMIAKTSLDLLSTGLKWFIPVQAMVNSACTKFVRCAKSSIPNMEILNKTYMFKPKNSKMIIFMRGGILIFSTNKG